MRTIRLDDNIHSYRTIQPKEIVNIVANGELKGQFIGVDPNFATKTRIIWQRLSENMHFVMPLCWFCKPRLFLYRYFLLFIMSFSWVLEN